MLAGLRSPRDEEEQKALLPQDEKVNNRNFADQLRMDTFEKDVSRQESFRQSFLLQQENPERVRFNPEKTRRNSWCQAFCDLYLETFSPLLVVIPIMFVHIGIARASILMFGTYILQTLCAKLNLESTRLQRENINFARNEDFETLISAPRVENSLMIAAIGKLYPILLVLNSTITIIICSIAFDQFSTTLLF